MLSGWSTTSHAVGPFLWHRKLVEMVLVFDELQV